MEPKLSSPKPDFFPKSFPQHPPPTQSKFCLPQAAESTVRNVYMSAKEDDGMANKGADFEKEDEEVEGEVQANPLAEHIAGFKSLAHIGRFLQLRGHAAPYSLQRYSYGGSRGSGSHRLWAWCSSISLPHSCSQYAWRKLMTLMPVLEPQRPMTGLLCYQFLVGYNRQCAQPWPSTAVEMHCCNCLRNLHHSFLHLSLLKSLPTL